MKLDAQACWQRLEAADHGVLGTVHPDRGVDLVPVVFAVTDDGRLVLPVDTVKAKATTRLRRLANLERDPRCSLLVEHYDPDWSRLWWVRATGTATIVDGMAEPLLRFDAYRRPGAVTATIVLTPASVTGWAA